MFSESNSRFQASLIAIPQCRSDGIRSKRPTAAPDSYSGAESTSRVLKASHLSDKEEISLASGAEKYGSRDFIWTFAGNSCDFALSRAQTKRNCSSGNRFA